MVNWRVCLYLEGWREGKDPGYWYGHVTFGVRLLISPIREELKWLDDVEDCIELMMALKLNLYVCLFPDTLFRINLS